MLRQYVVNAFDRGPFTGNPAAVVPLESWPDDDLLQAVGAQNNLSETAFFVPEGDGFRLRWFTPTDEIALCGHATLGAAHVIFEELGDGAESLEFSTMSGNLVVRRAERGYEMDFPAVATAPATGELESAARAAAGVESGEVLVAAGAAFLVLDGADAVMRLEPDLAAVAELPRGDLLVSAPGDGLEYDICARMFAPGVGIPEDPATGSAHCALAPYWSSRLGKSAIRSFQASKRGGYIGCSWREDDDRVDLTGTCTTFLRGEISV